MPSLNLPDRLIWFAHCPKAGGTSIETLMVQTWADKIGHLHWGWDLWWKRGGWRLAHPPNSPQHLIWADTTKVLLNQPDTVFALVRNPATRMLSEYRYQRHFRRGTWVGTALALLPFPLWLRLMLVVAQKNPYAFDNHLRPQSDFIPDHAHVFRIEDGIENVVSWLAKTTGTKLAAPSHLLKTEQNNRTDPATHARIIQAFEKDYHRFGYVPFRTPPPRRDLYDHMAAFVAPIAVMLERRGLL